MPAEKRDHAHHDGSSTRAFTAEQKAAVIRVRRCKATDFYDILGLEEVKITCSDGEIKKAYRKLSLLTHPDKNGYEGADEAFKMVSRAFQVLSDADKKSKYDKFGGDPDSRFGAASAASGASPFSGFASQRGARGRGPMFEDEISPEELFRQFFGGGQAFGGPFGGNGFVFNMGGGPSFRVHQFGGGQPRRRPHDPSNRQAPDSPVGMMQGYLFIILIVVFFLSSLFSGSGEQYPSTRFDAAHPHTKQHTSHKLNVPYYVRPADVEDYTDRNWRRLDSVAEERYINHLVVQCQMEKNVQNQKFQAARGWMKVDKPKWEAARNHPRPACDRLEGWRYDISRI